MSKRAQFLKRNMLLLTALLTLTIRVVPLTGIAPMSVPNIQEIINGLEQWRSQGFDKALAVSQYVTSYFGMLQPVPNSTPLIAEMDSYQQTDGLFYGRGEPRYTARTAQVLMAYDILGATPPYSLQPWMDTVDTWDKVKADIESYNPSNFYGELWGHYFTWVAATKIFTGKPEAPPWTDDMISYAEANPDTWLGDAHQRTHMMFIYFAYQKLPPANFTDTIISATLNTQGSDGGWWNDLWLTNENLHMLVGFKELGYDSGIDSAISQAALFVQSCYNTTTVGNQTVGYFTKWPGGPPTTYAYGVMSSINSGLIPGWTDPLWSFYWVYIANLSLNSIYEVHFECSLNISQGDQLILIFSKWSEENQGNVTVWSGVPPAHVNLSMDIPNPQGDPVEKVRLALLDDGKMLQNLALFTVTRSVLMERLVHIDADWLYASPATRSMMFFEIVVIDVQWVYAPF